MYHENQIEDHHLMQKLQEIIPQLRKQIQASLKTKHQQALYKLLQQKKQQLKSQYQQKLKSNIQQKNTQIKTSLTQMINLIDNYKAHQKTKSKNLSKQQQQQFIEQTVDEILSNDHMLQQVKNRLKPKLELKVKQTLDRQLDNGIQLVKKELVQRIQQDKQQWTQERIQFWKKQADLKSEVFANQHDELNKKKMAIEASLNAKKIEKNQLQQRLQSIMDRNARISHLRRQLKQLKQQIKV